MDLSVEIFRDAGQFVVRVGTDSWRTRSLDDATRVAHRLHRLGGSWSVALDPLKAAGDPESSPKILSILATDLDAGVRLAVAHNLRTPLAALAGLQVDPVAWVSQAARKTLKSRLPFVR